MLCTGVIVAAVRGSSVFSNDLFESIRKRLPGEHLDILFNVSWFGVREAHDQFKEVGRFCLTFAYSQRAEAFQVAANAILFFYTKFYVHKRLQ